jgi:hypothetical protein
MKIIATIAFSVLISGCAITYDAVQVGPNRFQTTANAAPILGGVAAAQNNAAKAANRKCTELGKTVNVVNVETGHDFPANGRAVMTFECD